MYTLSVFSICVLFVDAFVTILYISYISISQYKYLRLVFACTMFVCMCICACLMFNCFEYSFYNIVYVLVCICLYCKCVDSGYRWFIHLWLVNHQSLEVHNVCTTILRLIVQTRFSMIFG